MAEILARQTFPSIAHYLQWRAHKQSKQLAYRFLLEAEGEEVCVTYQELDAQAREIAARLRQVCDEGEHVLLLYPPGLSYIAAFFGCLYAGVIAVPAYPPHSNASLHRLQVQADNAHVRVTLTTQALVQRCKEMIGDARIRILCWPLTEDGPDGRPAEEYHLSTILNNRGLAYLQYTSGSTMQPRGVMITHQNLLYNLEQIQIRFRLTSASRGVIWLPPYHDMGLIGGILQPLYTGFPITLLSSTTFIRQPFRWLQAMSDFQGTSSGGPAFAFDLCTKHISPQQRAKLDLSSWNLAFCGAEPIQASTLEQFATTFASCGFRGEAFYPCYGLAEATVLVSGGRKTFSSQPLYVEKQALQERRLLPVPQGQTSNDLQALVSCGETIAEQEIRIVHPETLTPCQEQEIGEIWVTGPGVAQGYWGDAVATKQTFLASMQGDEQHCYLRTGDLGCFVQGELFVVGRLKDLIIIRGRNYYPQDIEHTLAHSHPALRTGATAVFLVQAEERLVVTQEVERGFQHSHKPEIFQAIRQAVVEEHGITLHDIVLVKPGGLSRTSSGKVQRYLCRERFLCQQLPVVESEHFQRTLEHTHSPLQSLQRVDLLAQDPVTRKRRLLLYLITYISHLVGISPTSISEQTTLSTLGMDSLMLMELRIQLEQDLQMTLPFSLLRHSLTLLELAEHISEQPEKAQVSLPWTLPPANLQLSLSYGQQALWFMHQLVNSYTIAKALEIRQELHIKAFHQALTAIVQRHPLLRTTFSLQEGIPVPTVHEHFLLDFEQEDCTGWDEKRLRTALEREAYRPFDLTHGPLLRVRLFSHSSAQHILFVAIDHIVCDLWSLIILLDELSILYQAACFQEPASLPTPSVTFAQYVEWQKTMLQRPEGQRLRLYWQQALQGVQDPVTLSTYYQRSRQQGYQAASYHFHIPAEQMKQLHELTKREGVTIYALLVSAFQVLHYRYSQREDLVIGTVVNGRMHAELARVVGYFVNPVALRGHLYQHQTFRELLQATYAQILQSLEYQDYPFPLLVEQLQPERNVDSLPFFRSLFVWQRAHLHVEQRLSALGIDGVETEIQLRNLTFKTLSLPPRGTEFDLTLTMAEIESVLEGDILYRTELFSPGTIASIARHFCQLLASIIQSPDNSIACLPLLSADEQEVSLSSWQSNEPEDASADEIHQHSSQQALALNKEVQKELPQNLLSQPQTELQQQLVSIWKEILRVEKIGLQDNFFALGGHSLLAISVLTRIRERLHVEAPVRSLFEYPTIAELEKLVQQLQKNPATSLLPETIQRVATESEPYPLSFSQEQLWSLSQIEADMTHYNEVGVVAIQGKLDILGLEQAFNEVVRRHMILRTVFQSIDGIAYQIIKPYRPIVLHISSIEDATQDQRWKVIQQVASQQQREILDLQDGPLFRLLVLRFSEEDHAIVCTIHHIIFDHWSIALLFQEISLLYQSITRGIPAQLPDLPLQYADFACWQRQRLRGTVEQQLINYWRKQLAQAPLEKPLFSDLLREANQTYQGTESSLVLDDILQQGIQQRSQELATTPFVLALTGFSLLLYHYTGQNDLVVGTDMAGRMHQELEALIGFFVNILPLRVIINEEETVRSLVHIVHEVVLDATQHQELPFSRIVDALGIKRYPNILPICQVLFVYQNTPHVTLSFPGVQAQLLHLPSEAARFDLVVFLEEREGQLITTWNYNQKLFQRATITMLQQAYHQLLHQVVSAPDRSVQACTQFVQMERMRHIMEQKERGTRSFASFRAQKSRSALNGEPHSIICTNLAAGKPFPRLIQSGEHRRDEIAQVIQAREFLLQESMRYGGLLFRGFSLATADDFEAFARVLCGKLSNDYGDLPHDKHSDFIYNSTPYPAALPILWHNEASHTSSWPQYILFYCVHAAQEGGETTLLDGRIIYQQLRPELRDRFENKKLQYVRNFVEGIDVSWQDFFQTNRREAVETLCAHDHITCEWDGSGNLKTSKIGEAIKIHPQTGEKSWFNQLLLHHTSSLDPTTREALLSLFPPNQLPRQVYYGDGTPIEDEVIDELMQLFHKHSVSVKLQAGDVLFVDNMLLAHRREPFVGTRKIMVAMGNMLTEHGDERGKI